MGMSLAERYNFVGAIICFSICENKYIIFQCNSPCYYIKQHFKAEIMKRNDVYISISVIDINKCQYL